MNRLIGIEQLCHRLSRSRTTVRRYLADPSLGFPRPLRVGPRDRMWRETEVEAWIRALPNACDQEPETEP